MRRKIIALLLAVLLPFVVASNEIAAASTIKNGSLCKTSSALTVSNGTLFKCVKSKGKLRWVAQKPCAKSGQLIKVGKFRYRCTKLQGRMQWVKKPAIVVTKPSIDGFTIGNLLWADEFEGIGTVDSASWTARYCDHSDDNGGGTCHNDESQYYLPSAIALDGSVNGSAVITTKRIYSPPSEGICLGSTCGFTSGRFDTQGKVSFQYGYYEARIKMPAGGGNWPAFWMLGDNITTYGWPKSGEIDIAEQGGNNPNRNSAAAHYSSAPSLNADGGHRYEWGEVIGGFDFDQGYHRYGLLWKPDMVIAYVDDYPFFSITPDTIRSDYWPFNESFFIILNNAIGQQNNQSSFGGLWDGWSTSKMSIDYVRVFAVDSYGTVTKQ